MWFVRDNSLGVRIAAVAFGLLMTISSAGAQQPLIADIVVRGNEWTPAEGILDEVKDILRIGEPYTPAKALAAREAIMKLGWYDTVALSYEQVREDVRVVIEVVEKQRIEQIVFVGNTVISDEELRENILTQISHVHDESRIRKDAGRIQEYYFKKGYIAQVAATPVDSFGALSFIINEAYVEDIAIEGLKRTHEWVVRRQIRTRGRELYQREQIAQDINRIFNMQLFGDVKLDLRPGKEEPSKAVIPIIIVEEKQTGMVSMAAAYSELDGFVAMLSDAENNFRGRAERISLDLELFGRSSYDFSFYEPYLDSKDTALDLSVFDTERQRRFVGGAAVTLAEDEFKERRTGVTVALARPTSETERITLGLRTEEVSSSYLQGVRELGGTTIAAVPGEDDEPIKVAAPLHPGGRVNSLTLGWRRDSRDIILNPTRGRYNSIAVECAGGLLAGENTYQQYRWDERRYWPVRGGRDVVALRVLLGTTTGNIPLFDSFSVGGAPSLRGYEQDRYRGESMVLANAEYRYGLSKSLTVVGFVDAGDAYGGSFRTVVPGFDITADDQDFECHVGFGFGIRAVTPLGPLRLDFGFGEDGSQTHFGFGHTF